MVASATRLAVERARRDERPGSVGTRASGVRISPCEKRHAATACHTVSTGRAPVFVDRVEGIARLMAVAGRTVAAVGADLIRLSVGSESGYERDRDHPVPFEPNGLPGRVIAVHHVFGVDSDPPSIGCQRIEAAEDGDHSLENPIDLRENLVAVGRVRVVGRTQRLLTLVPENG